jgi:hypothetical protein
MKRATMIGLVVMVAFLLTSVIYAGAQWYGYGTGYGAGTNVETMKKFQKETLSLRDDLVTKNLELQNEYAKPVPDTGRIVALKKEIIDLEANIQGITDKYNMPSGGYMSGMMMSPGGYGRGHGYGMMGGCGYGGW